MKVNSTDINQYSEGSAAEQGLALCHDCYKLNPIKEQRCERCHAHLHLRNKNSVQVTLALLLTAILFYIPANIHPIMITSFLGSETPSTIIGGVVLFVEMGSCFVAFVIFTASVIIPIAKIIALIWLCYNVMRKEKLKKEKLTRLYRITEFIGKWSMIDVFVVAILVSLVQVGNIMSINAGIAALSFAGVVIITMIAAHNFDSRLIWDKSE